MQNNMNDRKLRRFWTWWQSEATRIADAVYRDPPTTTPAGTPRLSRPIRLTMIEKLFLLFVVAVLAGTFSWQLAIDRRSSDEKAEQAIDDFLSNEIGLNDDSWVRSNPKTFGALVGVSVYIAGVLTIVAVDQRPKK